MNLVFTGPLVQRLWCHIEAVGPDEGANFRVDIDLSEVRRIGQGLKDTAPVVVSEVNVPDNAILEGQAQLVIADHLDTRNGNNLARKNVVHSYISNEAEGLVSAAFC